MADGRDAGTHRDSGATESPDPRNLIRETLRVEPDDPPNLHRLTTRQTLEERGVAEVQERFAGAGAFARQSRQTDGRHRRKSRR